MGTQEKEAEFVTFLDAEGNEISNDPRWHAQKVLAEAGLDSNAKVDELQATVAEKDAELEQLRAALAAAESIADEDDDAETEDEFSKLTGPELKEAAKQRGVDIKGIRKASEVRAKLREAAKA